MKRINWSDLKLLALIVLIVAALFGTVGYSVYLSFTCDGHVLRNVWNWPVCVK